MIKSSCEGDQRRCLHLPGIDQVVGKHPCDDDLPQKLLHRLQPLGPLHDDLDVIIQKADDAKSHRDKQHRDHLWIIPKIKHGRDDNTAQYDQAAHGRRSRFFQMSLRAVIPNLLAELQLVQKGDHNRTQDRADGKGDDNRKYGFINHIAPQILMYTSIVYVFLRE